VKGRGGGLKETEVSLSVSVLFAFLYLSHVRAAVVAGLTVPSFEAKGVLPCCY